MKALKINKSGWLWKIARFGGVPKDGMVPDKANLKYNRLLRAKHDAHEITYVEMKTEMKDSERSISVISLGITFLLFLRVCLCCLRCAL